MINTRSQSGFTLIEVIVVLAIIAIMSGIMVPMMYRVWESNDQEVTTNRLKDLQIALIGDNRLLQNGVRTSFGYVGDVGRLPSSLGNLVENSDAVANWKGPYLPAGFDTAKYKLDAWSQNFDYTLTPADGLGRWYEVVIRSIGSDRIADTADDQSLHIYPSDVLPVTSVAGNITILFSGPTQTNRNVYIGVTYEYRRGDGELNSITYCDPRTIAGYSGNAKVTDTQNFLFAPANNLPIGIITLLPGVYTDSACSVPYGGGTSFFTTVNAASSSIYANLQIQGVAP